MKPVDPVNIQDAIYSRYGTVRRANGYHLYTSKGKRLLDLYREGGAAILGWKSGKAKLVFKSLLDRGLTGTFPTEIDGELVRAVQELLPQYPHVRWYSSRERARRACAAFLDLWSEIPLMESPLLHPEAVEDIGPGGDSPLSAARQLHGIEVWRPWLDDAFYAMSDRVDSSFLRAVNESVNTMVLASPLPFAGGVTVAVFAPDSGESAKRMQESVPDSDPVSPALLGALARSFHDLSSEVFTRTDRDWAVFDRYVSPWWDRRGPYLVPTIRPSRYGDFFAFCLDNGILISPDYHVPSIIPFTDEPGELKVLVKGGPV